MKSIKIKDSMYYTVLIYIRHIVSLKQDENICTIKTTKGTICTHLSLEQIETLIVQAKELK